MRYASEECPQHPAFDGIKPRNQVLLPQPLVCGERLKPHGQDTVGKVLTRGQLGDAVQNDAAPSRLQNGKLRVGVETPFLNGRGTRHLHAKCITHLGSDSASVIKRAYM
jgi:hypothetical protein